MKLIANLRQRACMVEMLGADTVPDIDLTEKAYTALALAEVRKQAGKPPLGIPSGDYVEYDLDDEAAEYALGLFSRLRPNIDGKLILAPLYRQLKEWAKARAAESKPEE